MNNSYRYQNHTNYQYKGICVDNFVVCRHGNGDLLSVAAFTAKTNFD